jgi:hypothetical protein
MTNEQILEKQVEALEKLLQLKAAVIDELEAKIQRMQPGITWTTPQYIQTPYIPYQGGAGGIGTTFGGGSGGGTITVTGGSASCPDGTPHQYPSMCGGAGPSCCAKCGQVINYATGVTCVSTSDYAYTLAAQGPPTVASNQANVLALTNIAK